MKLAKTAVSVVLAAIALAMLLGVVADAAFGADRFVTTPCSISGAGIPGTLIEIPNNRTGEWAVEIDRNGQTLVFRGLVSGHTLARDGEPYRLFRDGVQIGSGVGQGTGCETTTTVTDSTTTTAPTTTTSEAPQPPVEPPNTTTTTTPPGLPHRPDADGDCGEGYFLDAVAGCVAVSEGG